MKIALFNNKLMFEVAKAPVVDRFADQYWIILIIGKFKRGYRWYKARKYE